MTRLERFRQADHAGRAAALSVEPRLRRAYARVLTAAARTAAARLRASTVTAAATGDPPASWIIPTSDDLYQALTTEARLREETGQLRIDAVRAVMAGSLAELGLSFDTTNPLVQGVLAQLGRNITSISEATRQDLMGILDKAWRDGLSIPDAAARLSEHGAALGATRATRIARTEILGAVNGGSLAAARLGGAVAYKQWLATDDERTRPDHVDADGQVAGVADTFTVGGTPMQYPGDQSAPAGETVNCRCTLTYPPDAGGF